MRKEVWEQIQACQTCFQFNSATVQVGTALESIRVTEPRQLLCIDFFGPMPFTANNDRYAIIAIDHFSKMAFGRVIANRNTETAISFLSALFKEYGPFKAVMGDRDSVFRGRKFVEFLTSQGCQQHVAQATHAEANGCCERFIKTLSGILAKMMSTRQQSSKQWDLSILDSISCYNGTPHSTIGAVPGEVFLEKPWHLSADRKFGVVRATPKQVSWADIVKTATKQQDNSISTANRHKWPHFAVGTRVAVVPRLANEKKHNADRRFRERKKGPYSVVAYEGKGVYKLTDGQQEVRGNAWELIPCSTGRFMSPPPAMSATKKEGGRVRGRSHAPDD
jgi:hypothetical protein